jgi:glycosyltransferase involved in cell wall biosynthesis
MHMPSSSCAAPSSGNEGRRLRILVVGDETVASTRYRILAHLPALEAAGYRTTAAFQKPRPAWRLLRLPLRLRDELRDLRQADDADLLLVQRRSYPPAFARMLGRRSRLTAFDIDDAIYLPSPSEPQSALAHRRYRRNFNATASAVDLVICGNAELAGEVEHKRKVVVPTAVDCDRFQPDTVGNVEGPTAGWVGHSSNLPYLEAIAGPLREVARRHPGFKLIVIADRKPRLEGVPVEFRRWSLEHEVECFKGIGVGLMPLDDTPWTHAKCAFKLLQYMALGLPAVASPVGMNREVVRPGVNGLLAATPDEWVSALDDLIRRPELRVQLGRAGRETVIRHFSVPDVSRRLLSVFDRLFDRVKPSGAHNAPRG